MKKIFVVLLLCLMSGKIVAQEFFGGIVVGGVTSQVEGDTKKGFNKIGFIGGFFAGLPLNETFSFQAELRYIQKGSHSDTEEEFYSLKLDYVDVPVFVEANLGWVKINDFTLRRISFELGLTFDFLARHSEETATGYNEGPSPWRKITWNTLVGVNFKINDSFKIGARMIDSINSIRTNVVAGNIRRYFDTWGEFNDILTLSVYWTL